MSIEAKTDERGETGGGPFYVVEVDGVEYRFDTETVTAAQIMEKAGIPIATGLVQILEDGTQRQVAADEIFELDPGRRFKKRPRFKRGAR